MRFVQLAVAGWVLLCPAVVLHADEPTGQDQPKAGAKVTAEEIDRLILQLGDDDTAKRAHAKKQLETIGEPAGAGLKKAVESADAPEVRKAAKAILEKLDAKARGLLHVFKGHNPSITALAITADGKVGVSSYDDGAVRVWDLDNFTLLRQHAEHVTTVMSVALSPDGMRIASGSSARMIRMWDRETGKEIRNFVAPAEVIYDVAFSPDGKLLLSGWGDGNARLFDAESGKLLQTLETYKRGRVWSVAFTPDGKHAVTSGGKPVVGNDAGDEAFVLWDIGTGKQVRRFEGHTMDVRRVAISPDGKRILSASYDSTVRLWDLATGAEIKKFDIPGNLAETVCFTPGGKRAV